MRNLNQFHIEKSLKLQGILFNEIFQNSRYFISCNKIFIDELGNSIKKCWGVLICFLKNIYIFLIFCPNSKEK